MPSALTPTGIAFHDSQAACPRSAQDSIANLAKHYLTLYARLNLTRLLGPIAMASYIASKFTADRELLASQLISNLCDGSISCHEAVNLISFDLAEVFVIHGNYDLQD